MFLPEDALLVFGYFAWANLVALVAFKLFTVNNWLEEFCDNNRDAWLYQLGGPP